MGNVQKSPYGDSGEVLRRYGHWNAPSGNRNKSLAEVVKIIELRLESQTLDDSKISQLLYMLPQNSNWQEVSKEINNVLTSRAQALKKSKDYHAIDHIKHLRRLVLNVFQERLRKLNQGGVLADKFDKPDKRETLNDRIFKYDERDKDYDLQDDLELAGLRKKVQEKVCDDPSSAKEHSGNYPYGKYKSQADSRKHKREELREDQLSRKYCSESVRSNPNLTPGGRDAKSKKTDKSYEKARKDKEERRYF